MIEHLGPAQRAAREILITRLAELHPWDVPTDPFADQGWHPYGEISNARAIPRDRCREVAHPTLAPILDESDGAVLDHAIRAATQAPRMRVWDAEFRCTWDSAARGERFYFPVIDPRFKIPIGVS